ncbi:uncharacterized protein (UPF0332 family) [Paraburkholderia bannensis]|uniref:Uncharacterized protein (UPF0332 family) n=1 Tax=Paraburkholderia bannensis TaxID=765414 RepID=A0A7W9WTU1_9BURK|nr:MULTISPECIES: HEPN domain-containing protein [Paraburkholderia]MBB3258110.1 uncharacterized protein (UPF0332 family) [Paraburkholderia sp. WP4_3_2]MBB6103123.1 uncharacterized protein (UPF0332 family) [Paraburkholderia bannensis]
MATRPLPVSELEFLQITANHLEFVKKLERLGWTNAEIREFGVEVGTKWFRLGQQHLDEAKLLEAAGCIRACHSRAYYAAYNVSKSVRYLVKGIVSLKGDDHGKASVDLPHDFPNVADWSVKISRLYEHRLRADYDNWSTTIADQTLSSQTAISDAESFIAVAIGYLDTKFGIKL